MSQSPLIGISAHTLIKSQPIPRYAVQRTYVQAVQQAGGLPVLLPPTIDLATARTLLARLDGLLLSGGGDVAAARYGAPDNPLIRLVDHARDASELALVAAVLRSEKPLLAICRGIQVLNVALGGTLYADIPSQVPGALLHRPKKGQPRDSSVHTVNLVPGSRLATILTAEMVRVNSFHHQSAQQVGRSLVVTAAAPDGVIEGLECPDHSFCLGVQWHPESPIGNQEGMERLFQALVEAARATMS